MSTSPQPPRAPVPPQPPRSGSNIVAIALLVLALIVLVSGIAVWTGLRFLSHNLRMQVAERGGRGKEVSINTPVGSIEVHHDVNQDSLGLPIYPGATPVKDKDSAAVNLGFGGEASVQVLAAKFETSDSLERVKAFYKEHLGSEVTKFTDRGSDGKTTFEIKTHNLEKVVALEGGESRTLIKLVRVSFGKNESN
ncbi:MAG: hypothetical protein ABSF73_08320 [Terriglobia bacterium]